jgi:Zn finger protein HypA/HybF involved in hydrogenase expression
MLARDTHNRREMRRCLKCNRSFLSRHRFNKLCENCAKQNANVNFGEYVLNVGFSSRRSFDELE